MKPGIATLLDVLKSRLEGQPLSPEKLRIFTKSQAESIVRDRIRTCMGPDCGLVMLDTKCCCAYVQGPGYRGWISVTLLPFHPRSLTPPGILPSESPTHSG